MGNGSSTGKAAATSKKGPSYLPNAESDEGVSDFYRFCQSGNIDRVREILDAADAPHIAQLNALQPNGSTALHAAVEQGHREVVELLLDRDCPMRTRDSHGDSAGKLASNTDMHQLLRRKSQLGRFREPPVVDECIAAATPPPIREQNNASRNYVHNLTSEVEIRAHAENQQTTATWIKFFQWFTTRFPRLVTSDEFNPDIFVLHRHYDLLRFLRLNVTEPIKFEAIMKLLQDVHERDSIRPLIELYSSQRLQFFSILNRQLASPTGDAERSPYLCDRVIFEFYLREAELKRMTHTGKTYRGLTMSDSELAVYRRALASEPAGTIVLKTFTSTSKSKDIAYEFMEDAELTEHKRLVLFVYELRDASPTIVDIGKISLFSDEQEVLMLPHNLFTVTEILNNVEPPKKFEKTIATFTQIRMRYKHVQVPFWKKLKRVGASLSARTT